MGGVRQCYYCVRYSIVHHVLDTKCDALIEMYIALQMEMVQ